MNGREYVVVRSMPYLSSRAGEDLERELERHLDLGKRHFIINFEDTEIVNSLGVSILIGIIERVKQRKGSIGFSNLSKVNENIFRMMGLLKYAPIVKAPF